MSLRVHGLVRIGTDPEYRQVNDTGGFLTFRVASNRSFTKKDGTRDTDWYTVNKWVSADSKLPSILAKGKQIYIDGTIENDNYEKDGNTIYRDVIRANEIMLTGSRGSTDATSDTAEAEASNGQGDDGLPF